MTSRASRTRRSRELCARVAALLGMEAAVFLPSGTMCNEIAFRLHIRPGGDEAILHRTSHPIIAEAGGPAAFAGAMMQPLDTPQGHVHRRRRARRAALPATATRRARGSCRVEQSTNMAGGRVWPLEQLRGVVDVAQEHGLRLHMDGARLMNAVVASGVPAAEFTRGLRHRLAGLHQGPGRAARRLPGRLGGADRGGVALQADARRRAAPGGDRRRRARCTRSTTTSSGSPRTTRTRATLARGLAGVAGVTLDPGEVETNIVIFEVDDPGRRRARRWSATACGWAWSGARRVRAVTHLDVDADGVQRARAGRSERRSHDEARRHPPHHRDHRRCAAQRRLLRRACSGCGWSRRPSTRTTRPSTTSSTPTRTAPPAPT